MIDLRYWNARPDNWLVLRPGVKPVGPYISFDPVNRCFHKHLSYPMEKVHHGVAISSDRIDPLAVAEAIAHALTIGRG